jgi:hypothetical protein
VSESKSPLSHEPTSIEGDQGTSNTPMPTSPPALSQAMTHDFGPPLLTFDGDNGPSPKNPVLSKERWNLNHQLLAQTNFDHTQQSTTGISSSFTQRLFYIPCIGF